MVIFAIYIWELRGVSASFKICKDANSRIGLSRDLGLQLIQFPNPR